MAAVGVEAFAALDSSRPFFTSARMPGDLAMLDHAGRACLPADVTPEFERAAALVDSVVGSRLRLFAEGPESSKEQLFRNYQYELKSPGGIGFALRYNGAYHPTYDLAAMLAPIRQLVTSDRYEPRTVVVGEGLAEGWFIRKHRWGRAYSMEIAEQGPELSDAIRDIRGGVSVTGLLRPQYCPGAGNYTLSVQVVEFGTEASAGYMLGRCNQTMPRGIHVRWGVLLALVSAHQDHGGEACETHESLKRFVEPLLGILADGIVEAGGQART